MAITLDGTNGITTPDLNATGEINADIISNEAGTGAPNFPNGLSVNSNPLPTAGSLGNRNLIINGAMQVWQRGVSRTFSSTNYVTVDRFQPAQYQQAGYERVAVSGSGPDAQYALRVTSSSASEAAGGTRMSAGQMIESVNCQPVIGKQVTLSFWIKFSAASIPNAGDFSFAVWEFDAVDPSFGMTGPNRFTQELIANGSFPTTWTKYSLTSNIDAITQTLAVRFTFVNIFSTTNNSDAYYDITEVQLEAGDTATPFEYRSYGQELALCQRYFTKLGGEVAGDIYLGGYITSAGAVFQTLTLPVKMRAAPTGTVVGTWGVVNVAQPIIPYIATNTFAFYAGGTVVGQGLVYTTGTTTYLTFSAEL